MSDQAVKAGDELGPVEHVTDPEQMKLMAALLRDPNPIHFDVESVKSLGMGDRVVTQGPMTVSFVADLVTTWAGDAAALRSLQVRMLGNVFGGDTVVCSGTVTAVDGDTGLISLDVQATVDGRPVVSGTATVLR
jgi:acyl dehydratase